tara:strand:- start:2764 stop:2922 length:159 start_codon:yes stop_codon:yes gene_type:complete
MTVVIFTGSRDLKHGIDDCLWDSERLHVRCIGKAHPWLYSEPTIVLGSFNAG